MLSRTAALLLLIQWALGFNLLAGEGTITPFHYLAALGTLFTVGLEHGPGYNEPDQRSGPRSRSRRRRGRSSSC
jgi:hypothetical protein